MKKLKSTKVIASTLVVASVLALNPVRANAEQWIQIKEGVWDVRDDNGKYKDGWVKYGTNWYYAAFGHMVTNCYEDGYYLGEDGAWTDSPTSDITSHGKVISPESVKATSDMYNKLLNQGWQKYHDHWYDNFAYLLPLNTPEGYHYFTRCYINSGVATVQFLTNCQSYEELEANKSTGKYIELPLDEYLKYKKEGKIGTFTYYTASVGGSASSSNTMTTMIQEYIKKDSTSIKAEALTPEQQKKNEENRKKLEAAGYHLPKTS